MRSKYVGVPWKEVDGASFCYSKEHYAPIGRELMEWSVVALDWIDEVFPRDARVRKSMRRFIPVFLHHIESNKLTLDGRQFALLPLKTIMKDMGVARLTAKETVARFALTGRYEYLRSSHKPILEVIEETVPGAKAGRWGYGYAPVVGAYEKLSAKNTGIGAPGSEKAGINELGMGRPGSISGVPGPAAALPGSLSEGAGSSACGNGEPSTCSIFNDSLGSKEDKGFEGFIRLFPKGAGTKLNETRRRYDQVVGWGVSPEGLYDAAVRHLNDESNRDRSQYPLHFLNRDELLASLLRKAPRHFEDDKLMQQRDGSWIYLFPGGYEYVRCPKGSSRKDAAQAVVETARERGLFAEC